MEINEFRSVSFFWDGMVVVFVGERGFVFSRGMVGCSRWGVCIQSNEM